MVFGAQLRNLAVFSVPAVLPGISAFRINDECIFIIFTVWYLSNLFTLLNPNRENDSK